ncbi:MAG: ATP-binding protein, partial [Anaerolineae bacterium]|nr:ATP-binding protein [Anaerolineae bacterium]
PQIIDSSVETVRPLVQMKGLVLTQLIPEDLPEVYCDRTRVQQVILNLISNATRFTQSGGIAITVEQQDREVTVSVQDTGAGISPHDLTKIFEPFEQGTLWHGRGGTGLGLSISKRFVEIHGGRMWVESEVDVGTTFSFTLPISPPIQHLVRSGHSIQTDWVWHEGAFQASRASYSDALVKPRVILYDEGGELAMWLEHYSDDIEFVRTQSLDQIGAALASCPAHAVLCNVPDPNALPSMLALAQPNTNGTPIVGCCIPRAAERATVAGAMGHLTKPVTKRDLASAVAAVPTVVHSILLVDDDPDVLQLFHRMLHVYDPDLEILTASSGYEALSQLRRSKPDMMLLDIVMSDIDGWQVLSKIREDPDLPDIPTFLVSAQDQADRPLVSDLVFATIKGGIPLRKVLQFTQVLSSLLLEIQKEPDPALV